MDGDAPGDPSRSAREAGQRAPGAAGVDASRPTNRSVLRLSLLTMVLCGALAAWGWMFVQQTLDRVLDIPANHRTVTFEVPPGASVRSVAAELGNRGWLRHPWVLRVATRIDSRGSVIKAGEYAVHRGTTLREFIRQLVRGKAVQHALTLVEGWTFRQLRAAIASSPHLRTTLDGVSDAELMSRLGRPGVAPEGRFLPETYHFPAGTTDFEFLRRALRAMEQRLASEWDARAPGLPLENADQALVLASIIEKETGLAAERPRIAGVFIRRLQRGMRLETDPTVIYGLGAQFDGNLTRADLRRDTPYNTYTRKGLPPTPIALPGADAIRAALHPQAGDALYFVARGDGGHEFSATYAQHRRAVDRYQRRRRK